MSHIDVASRSMMLLQHVDLLSSDRDGAEARTGAGFNRGLAFGLFFGVMFWASVALAFWAV